MRELHLAQAEGGLQDPQWLQQQIQQQNGPVTPSGDENEPAGANLWTTDIPIPGSGYGPKPCDKEVIS